jgi:hypothetical protein
MLSDNWPAILFLSFCLVAIVNSLIASGTTLYYKKKPVGRLSHNQLRIKQGNATLEHRLNVFAQSLIFSIVTFRIYLFTLLLGLAINIVLYFSA